MGETDLNLSRRKFMAVSSAAIAAPILMNMAGVVLEKAIGLNYDGQRVMIKSLEKIVRKHKIKAVIGGMQIE